MLDNRLATVAAMVQPCALVADIGTDHGFLVCELVKNGICTHGIAADINAQPLARARAEIARQSLAGQIETTLTDGLAGITPAVEAVVIAGMGGELIAQILESWPHSRQPGRRYYLQPMTKAERLRAWLWQQGFDIMEERCCTAAGKAYTVLAVVYVGQKIDYTPVDLWLGRIRPAASAHCMDYCKRLAKRLETQARGMAAGQHDPARLAQLQQIIDAIHRRIDYEGSGNL